MFQTNGDNLALSNLPEVVGTNAQQSLATTKQIGLRLAKIVTDSKGMHSCSKLCNLLIHVSERKVCVTSTKLCACLIHW